LAKPDKIFFDTKGKKIEKCHFFRGNFPNSNYRWLTRPNPSNKKIDGTQPRSKMFDLYPSLNRGQGGEILRKLSLGMKEI